MIRAIEITNFQGFAGEHKVTLAPITIVLGANATGKSTLGRVLKLISQSPDGLLEFSGKNTDLVSFGQAIFGQLVDPTISKLAVSVKVPLRTEHFKPNSPRGDDEDEDENNYWDSYLDKLQEILTDRQVRYLADHLETYAYFAQEQVADEMRHIEHVLATGFEYTEPNTKEIIGAGFGWKSSGMSPAVWDPNQMLLITDDGHDEQLAMKHFAQVLQTIFVKTLEVESHLGTLLERLAGAQNISWLASLLAMTKMTANNGLVFDPESLLQSDPIDSLDTTFLGGLLEAASRARKHAFTSIFEVSGVRDFRLNATKLTGDQSVIVQTTGKARDKTLQRSSEALMKLTNGRYSVHRESVRTSTSVTSSVTEETFVVDNLTSARVSFDNVGAGIGQLLPILNGLYEAPANKTLLIEQPELHLHPKAQADLASLFVDAIDEGNVEQLILETHSEAMLLRFQRLIREGKLRASDVAIVVTQEVPMSEDQPNVARGNMIYNIELTDDGELKEPMLLSFAGVRLDEFL